MSIVFFLHDVCQIILILSQACMQFCRIRRTIDTCTCIPPEAPDLNFTGSGSEVGICYTKRSKYITAPYHNI